MNAPTPEQLINLYFKACGYENHTVPPGRESTPKNPGPPPAAFDPNFLPAHQEPTPELLATAKRLFGDNLELVAMNDDRIPLVYRNICSKFKAYDRNKFHAVNCDLQSNLAAIILPCIEDRPKKFFALNPKLHKTLLTKWNQLIFVWVRIEGWRPANRAMCETLWISNGMLPTVVERMVDSKCFEWGNDLICSFKFHEINWPEETRQLFLLEHMEAKHGPLVQLVGPRKRVLNYRTAAFYLSELAGLVFDQNQGTFHMRLPGETKFQFLTKTALNFTVSTWLAETAAKMPGQFPLGDHLKIIVRTLKEICAMEKMDEPDGLNAFLAGCVERRPGANLTTKELFTAYSDYCRATNVVAYPECIFFNVLPKLVREKYGLTKVHNIMRTHESTGQSTARYGFNGLGLKLTVQEAPDVKEPKEVREVPEGGAGI